MEAEINLNRSELWKMSASYPAPTGEIETRRILKTLNETYLCKQDETNVNIMDISRRSISKLTFLRILLLDITLSSVYLTVNIFLLLHLLSGEKDDNSWSYGVIMIIILWMPAIFILPNEIYYRTELIYMKSVPLNIVLGFIFFPVLQIFLYLNQLRRREEDTKYMRRLDKVKSIKDIIHCNLHMILLIFLGIRGYLLKENESSCIIDNLGRSACFTSPVIMSGIISIYFLVRSQVNLYMDQEQESGILNILEQPLRYLPYLTSGMIFRIISYAFILNYIDYWTIIPVFCIILVQIILQGYIVMHTNDKEEDETAVKDEVDALCTMIWNGNEWVCPAPVLQDTSTEETCNPQKLEDDNRFNVSYVLQGFISSIAIIPCENILASYTVNGMIILVIITINILVNYIQLFQYEDNILDNRTFNHISIFLICYGLFSPPCILLIHKNTMNRTFVNICSIFLVLVVISVPLIIYLLGILISSTSTIYLYTIESNMNGSIITILGDIQTRSNIQLQDRFRYTDIYWDTTCKNTSVQDKMLIIMDITNSECKNILENNNSSVSILFLELDTQYRSSSGYNMDTKELIINMKYDLQRMESDVKKYEYLYISREEPNPSIIRQYLTCSQSSIIQIVHDEDIRENNCNPVKILNMNNQLIEKQCVYIKDGFYVIHVQCSEISSSPKFVYKDKNLDPVSIIDKSGLKYSSCCINSSHAIDFVGHCNLQNIDAIYLKESDFGLLKEGHCTYPMNFQNWLNLFLSSTCILKMSFIKPCNNSLKVVNTCFSTLCNV